MYGDFMYDTLYFVVSYQKYITFQVVVIVIYYCYLLYSIFWLGVVKGKKGKGVCFFPCLFWWWTFIISHTQNIYLH